MINHLELDVLAVAQNISDPDPSVGDKEETREVETLGPVQYGIEHTLCSITVVLAAPIRRQDCRLIVDGPSEITRFDVPVQDGTKFR